MPRFTLRTWLRNIAYSLPSFGVAAWLVGTAAFAQEPASAPLSKTYLNKTTITLPVLLEDKHRAQLQSIQLFVKEGPNGVWKLHEKAAPTQTSFTYRASRENEFWFSIVSVDNMGRAMPPDVEKEAPGLIVVIDTQAPNIDVQPQQATPEGQFIRCDARDANLDRLKTRFFYQTGDMVWRDLSSQPGKADVFCVPAQAVWTGQVRAVATDLAGNTTTREMNASTATASETPTPVNIPNLPDAPRSVTEVAKNLPTTGADKLVVLDPTTLQPQSPMLPPLPTTQQVASNPPPVSSPMQPSLPPLPNAGGSNQRPGNLPPDLLVKNLLSAQSNLPLVDPASNKNTPAVPAPNTLYDVKTTSFLARDTAPTNRHLSNSTRMFLEYKVDALGASGVGRVEVWYTRDLGTNWNKLSEDTDKQSPAEINLPGEGLYGVSLVVTNGRGFGGTPPKSGDAPDYWAEIDTTRPIGDITAIHAGDDGALHITWIARDKNLATEPIELSYASNRDGPWQPIAKAVKNDGLYRWVPPVEVGPQAFFRLSIRDQAGNMSTSETHQPVPLDDQSRPRGRVLGISTSVSRPTANGQAVSLPISGGSIGNGPVLPPIP